VEDTKAEEKFKLDKKKIEWIAGITGLVASFYPIVNYINNIIYQKSCEDFYHIPGKYFHTTVNNKIIYFVGIVLLFFIWFLPAFVDKKKFGFDDNSFKSKMLTAVMIIYLGMIIGIINIDSVLMLLRKAEGTIYERHIYDIMLKIGPSYVSIIIVAVGVIAVVGSSFFDKIREIKYKWIQKGIAWIVVVIFAVNLLLMFSGLLSVLGRTVVEKRLYEVIEFEDEEYIVLSEHEDTVLVSQYSCSNGQYTIYTKEYYFIEKGMGAYSYVELSGRPSIICDKTKEEVLFY